MDVPWWFWVVVLGVWAGFVWLVIWADSRDEAADREWWDRFDRRFDEKDKP